MSKHIHEIRDPIHVFVHLSSDERRVLDSPPFQRLRHIHQLAMTYLVYPGATHRRFEHSLGVMELADRVFDVVTKQENLTDQIRNEFREIATEKDREYWRCVLRMAALCHDMGHLPFSHAAEKELLPKGWSHERITAEIVLSDIMKSTWKKMKIDPEDVVKIAVGPKELKAFEPDTEFSPWETILAEIIVGDAFGVDRMDYLLRDSHHTGVAYGKFDHYRLIDSIRILPDPEPHEPYEKSNRFTLGVGKGGIQSAESLMLARYFMFSQVYLHPIRRIYDIHLKDFLLSWLHDDGFSTKIQKHLRMTDMEVSVAILNAARQSSGNQFIHAQRITNRKHFKVLYERNPNDRRINPEAGESVYNALCSEFGPDYFRHDRYPQKGGAPDFPVQLRDGKVISSLTISKVLNNLPIVSLDFVFADRNIIEKARDHINENHDEIIALNDKENNNAQA